ncbi:hypothetical protein LINPERHAP1_LOCUS36569, partial [Linum perenne]
MICLLHRIRQISICHQKLFSTYLQILVTIKFMTRNLRIKAMMIVMTTVPKKFGYFKKCCSHLLPPPLDVAGQPPAVA